MDDGRAAHPEDALAEALTARISSASWRTSRACGFSDDTSEFMNSKTWSSAVGAAISRTTRTPEGPQTTRSPWRASEIAMVRTARSPSAAEPVTRSPQSISGCSTSTQWPSSRTCVNRLVVE